jgi:hypothetical protein
MSFHPCVILPFPARRSIPAAQPLDTEALTTLGLAEDLATSITSDLGCAHENVTTGSSLAGQRPALDRAMTWAVRLSLHLINLRGNPPEDHALSGALRQWLKED